MQNHIVLLVISLSAMISGFSQQNVGIGTNSPTYPLTVIAPNGGRGIVQKTGAVEVGFFTTGSVAFLQTWTNYPLQFATNNSSAQMTLTTNGNLGIGITSPSSMLDVNGQLRLRGGSPGAGKVLMSDANGLGSWEHIGVKATNATLSTSPSLNNATGLTVPFQDDNVGSFSDLPGFNNSNYYFEVTAATAGTYLISAQVTWDILNSFTGEKDFVLELRRGISTIATNRMISEYISTFINTNFRSQQITCTAKLSAGQQISLWAMQRTGVVQQIEAGEELTYMSLIRLY